MIGVLLTVLSLTAAANSLHRPDYIVPCSRKNNFNACALEHAKIAIPHLINGDKKLGLPRMDPLEISLVDLRGAEDFHLSIRNIKVHGLSKTEILNMDIDFDRQRGHVSSRAPRVEILGDYNMSGHLMIFPINGHGFVNITLSKANWNHFDDCFTSAERNSGWNMNQTPSNVDGYYDYYFGWTTEQKHGEDYGKLVNTSYDYRLGNVKYDFTNLMNGNERLSKVLNNVLNENWQLVNEDLKESTKQTLLAIHDNLFGRVYARIPFKELFFD